jgi:hypothetical protein
MATLHTWADADNAAPATMQDQPDTITEELAAIAADDAPTESELVADEIEISDPESYGGNRATYCPEDNKLRLYVGRVPRDEYLALKAEGWTSTPKQDCDFVAAWTPARRDRAESYAGIIEDEDAGPAERAADRAERFAGYREKRRDEAGASADRYDAQPGAYGYQSQARADRAARRHDGHASRAVDAWSKAEYWQQRTAGVISHALHGSRPDVRMGRIKELEADQRRQTPGSEWHTHTTLRLAYENQMLEAQGGRAAFVEMEAGGFLGSHQITKVCKSPATGRVTSVEVEVMSQTNRWGNEWPDGKGARMVKELINIERMKASVYTPPTDEERAAYAAKVKAAKKTKAGAAKEKAAKGENCPLINPTNEDAIKMQDEWNAKEQARHAKTRHWKPFEPVKPLMMTQAQYSAQSGGNYARFETLTICEAGTEHRKRHFGKITRHDVFKLRVSKAFNYYQADRIIIISDKPQKAIPWQAIADARAKCPSVESVTARLAQLKIAIAKGWQDDARTESENLLISDAVYIGYADTGCNQPAWTDAGREALKEYEAAHATPAFALAND